MPLSQEPIECNEINGYLLTNHLIHREILNPIHQKEEFDSRMLRGEPTLQGRMVAVPFEWPDSRELLPPQSIKIRID